MFSPRNFSLLKPDEFGEFFFDRNPRVSVPSIACFCLLYAHTHTQILHRHTHTQARAHKHTPCIHTSLHTPDSLSQTFEVVLYFYRNACSIHLRTHNTNSLFNSTHSIFSDLWSGFGFLSKWRVHCAAARAQEAAEARVGVLAAVNRARWQARKGPWRARQGRKWCCVFLCVCMYVLAAVNRARWPRKETWRARQGTFMLIACVHVCLRAWLCACDCVCACMGARQGTYMNMTSCVFCACQCAMKRVCACAVSFVRVCGVLLYLTRYKFFFPNCLYLLLQKVVQMIIEHIRKSAAAVDAPRYLRTYFTPLT